MGAVAVYSAEYSACVVHTLISRENINYRVHRIHSKSPLRSGKYPRLPPPSCAKRWGVVTLLRDLDSAISKANHYLGRRLDRPPRVSKAKEQRGHAASMEKISCVYVFYSFKLLISIAWRDERLLPHGYTHMYL